MLTLKEGALVKVSSINNFSGFKLGIFIRLCKKDSGYIVYLTSTEDVGFREICIVPDRGDTIISIVKE